MRWYIMYVYLSSKTLSSGICFVGDHPFQIVHELCLLTCGKNPLYHFGESSNHAADQEEDAGGGILVSSSLRFLVLGCTNSELSF